MSETSREVETGAALPSGHRRCHSLPSMPRGMNWKRQLLYDIRCLLFPPTEDDLNAALARMNSTASSGFSSRKNEDDLNALLARTNRRSYILTEIRLFLFPPDLMLFMGKSRSPIKFLRLYLRLYLDGVTYLVCRLTGREFEYPVIRFRAPSREERAYAIASYHYVTPYLERRGILHTGESVFFLPNTEDPAYGETFPRRWGCISEFNGVVLRRYGRGRVGVVLDFELAQEFKAKWLDNQKPPRHAKFLLLLVPRKHLGTLVGDLEEDYQTRVLPEFGPVAARFWYWWQVMLEIVFAVIQLIRPLAGR